MTLKMKVKVKEEKNDILLEMSDSNIGEFFRILAICEHTFT